MAWYSDEQYSMIEDSREKKHTAASAFKQRTHCGKGGGVKLPSDFMTKKERNAMNGECVSYRMNDPITWEVFKTWPEEHQKSYIINVREKYNTPNTELAKAMGVHDRTLNSYIKCLGLSQGSAAGGLGRLWPDSDDAIRFWAWWKGEDVPQNIETPDLRKPMRFSTFKNMSDENKIEYINWLRDYFGTPDKYIAEELFRVSNITLRKELAKFDLCAGRSASRKPWNKESFIAWCDQIKKVPVEGPVTKCEPVTETIDDLFQKHVENIEAAAEAIVESLEDVEEENVEVVESVDIAAPVEEEACKEATEECHTAAVRIPVIPTSGCMTFNNVHADDALATINTLLGNMRVNLTISWDTACAE